MSIRKKLKFSYHLWYAILCMQDTVVSFIRLTTSTVEKFSYYEKKILQIRIVMATTLIQ